MIRTYEAAVGVVAMILVLTQFITFSAGRLGEQWDGTALDVEVKCALEEFQLADMGVCLERYSKIRDPDLLRMPDAEGIGYRVLLNGKPVDNTEPPANVEVAATDARVYSSSRDAALLVPSLRTRLLRSDYVLHAGKTMDYDSVDELAQLVMALLWDESSWEILSERVDTLVDNQNDDGGWGFVKGEESDTLSTSFAVRAVAGWIVVNAGDPQADLAVTQGIAWLKSGVHADGGYGAKERLESATDMTAYVILAYLESGLAVTDPWVEAARDFLLRLQRSDGGFPIGRRGGSDPAATAVAIEALMAIGGSESAVEQGSAYLGDSMVTDGNFTFSFSPRGGSGTYDVEIHAGYVLDCSPRGYEFWGDHIDEPIIAIVAVYGDRDNMTVELRIERSRLVPPDNKHKIALCFSHNSSPDDTDWWILNAGNPHTAGQGDQVDDPKFDQHMIGVYTHLTVTNLEVPDEYEFFAPSEDWLIAIVGDAENSIQDNIGRGYNIGYWRPWMKEFFFNNILAWASMGSPRINRVCLDLDQDAEFDDMRLTHGDSVIVGGREWVLGIESNETFVNLSFRQVELGYTRFYYPHMYDISSIPESASSMYHFGVISVYNKPSFTKDYKVVLRDSVEEGVYDEAYIYDGSMWNAYPDGSLWVEGGNTWLVEVEDDFLALTNQNSVAFTGLSGPATLSTIVEGDFAEVSVDLHGPTEVMMVVSYLEQEIERGVFDSNNPGPIVVMLGTWGGLRETSKVYHALSWIEFYLTGGAARSAHDIADLCQQAIKFNKVYNSVVEDRLDVQAWYKSQGL